MSQINYLIDNTSYLIPLILELLFIMIVTISLLVCSYLSLLIHFSENIMYSVISLFFLTVSMSFIMLIICNVDFFSIVYILIYLGAIIVLFLFVLMTADLRKDETIVDRSWIKMLPFISTFLFLPFYFIFPSIVNSVTMLHTELGLLDYIIPTGNWQTGNGFATMFIGDVSNFYHYWYGDCPLVFVWPVESFLVGFGSGYDVYLNDIYIFSNLLYGFFFEYTITMSILLFFTLVVTVGMCLQTETYVNQTTNLFLPQYTDMGNSLVFFFRYQTAFESSSCYYEQVSDSLTPQTTRQNFIE